MSCKSLKGQSPNAQSHNGLGATGIARSYIMVDQYGNSIFDEVEDDALIDHLAERKMKHAPNIEFEIKYKTLSEKLYTQKAREIAIKRINTMNDFFNI